MDARATFRLWRDDTYFDAATRTELAALSDPGEVEDRFYRHLSFGTGGLRGVMGAGTNRMNRYIVRRASAGLAACIAGLGPEAMNRGVVVAHDSRHRGAEFALEAALTLAAAGVRAFLFDALRPTPLLSFAVRHLGAHAGVVITASHNPPDHNGYKVYWEDGGQVPPERAEAIESAMAAVTDIRSVAPIPAALARSQGLLDIIGPEVDDAYLEHLGALPGLAPGTGAGLRVLYTPLHGAGAVLTRQALAGIGCEVRVVATQMLADGNFPTVPTPNPEEPSVFDQALTEADADPPDLILATDPDADRLGAMVRDTAGTYRLLTGNQLGAILTDYLLGFQARTGTLPTDGVVVKTLATANLVAPICRHHGVRLEETHTGFKFIGDKIAEYERKGTGTFVFGFEESYGYLAGTFVRDKDGVMAAALTAAAAAWHRGHGRTLCDALLALWDRWGHHREALHGFTLNGRVGQERIGGAMRALRADPPLDFAGVPVERVDDYLAGVGRAPHDGKDVPLALPAADVLQYRLPGGGFVLVRPSGTEPKLKVYVAVREVNAAGAENLLQAVREAAVSRLTMLLAG